MTTSPTSPAFEPARPGPAYRNDVEPAFAGSAEDGQGRPGDIRLSLVPSALDRRPWWRDALLRRMLACADATAGATASLPLVLAAPSPPWAVLWAAIVLPAWILLSKLHGLYDRDQRTMRHLTVDELPSIAVWAVSGTVVVAIALSVTAAGHVALASALEGYLLAGTGAVVLRGGARLLWRRITPPERALIVGAGPLAQATRRKLRLFPDMHLRLANEHTVSAEKLRPELLDGVDRLVLASEVLDDDLIARAIGECRRRRIKLSVIPPLRGMLGTAAGLDRVADLPVLQYTTWDVSRSTLVLKRGLDLAVALLGLIAATPLVLALAVAIRLDSRGPVIFAQERTGQNGRPFTMFKLRSMVANAEGLLPELVELGSLPEPVFKLRDDPRVTRAGRFIRRASLDELPQLWNVLRGEMSLVGPRPEQVELVARYSPAERFRLAVKPGMTGPMQVFGRGRLGFEERLAVERDYIENLSLGRDLRILGLTVTAVVSGRGAS